jgi:hypothetical protein
VTEWNLAFQRSIFVQSILIAIIIFGTVFFTFVRNSVGEFTSFLWVANISGTWILVITSDCGFLTCECLGFSINDTIGSFTFGCWAAFFNASIQVWVTFRIVDQDCSASLSISIANSFLTFICQFVGYRPRFAINFIFANWISASRESFVKCVDASLFIIARVSSTFVVIIASVSSVFANKIEGGFVISAV